MKSPTELDAEIAEVRTTCPTCVRPVGAPYRRSVNGKVVEGCIDECHTGHLYGTSLEWHNRPVAKKLRAETKKRLREILKSGRSRR